MLPRLHDYRNQKAVNESLFGAIRRHLLILLQHEVGRAREDQIIGHIRKGYLLGGPKDHSNFRPRL